MQLTPRQTYAFNLVVHDRAPVVVFGGGIRGGKTWWGLLTFCYLASQYPKSRWVVVRRTLIGMRTTTFKSWQSIQDGGIRPHIAAVDNYTHTYTFSNGSELIFMGENYDEDKELNRFRGLETNGIMFDEVNECQEVTFEKGIERAGSWNHAVGSPPNVVLATLNPSNGWVRKRIYDKYLTKTLPPGWHFVPSLVGDNPHNSEEYLSNLKSSMTPLNYQRFVLGDWDALRGESLFADEFDQSAHVSENAVLNQQQPLIISIDWNLQPFGVTFGHVYRAPGGLIISTIDEAQIEKGSIQAMAQLIKMRYGGQLRTCKLTGDRNGRAGSLNTFDNASNFETLRRLLNLRESQLEVPPNPSHADSRADMNYLLWKSKDARSGLRYMVHPKCTGVIRDLNNVQVDLSGDKVEIKKKNRIDPNQQADLLDCERYKINTFASEMIRRHQQHGAI